MDDEIDMDEAAQVCLLNTLQPGGSLVAAGKNLSISMSMPPCSRASEDTGLSYLRWTFVTHFLRSHSWVDSARRPVGCGIQSKVRERVAGHFAHSVSPHAPPSRKGGADRCRPRFSDQCIRWFLFWRIRCDKHAESRRYLSVNVLPPDPWRVGASGCVCV